MRLVLSVPATILLAQHQLLTVSDMLWSSYSTLLTSMPWADPVPSSAKRLRPSSESCRRREDHLRTGGKIGVLILILVEYPG